LVSIALVAAACSIGCGSSSGTNDGAVSGSAGTGGPDGSGAGGASGSGVCGNTMLFGLSTGDSCFDIVSVMPGSNDGCMLGVADTTAMMGLVGASLPVNYDMSTATLTVGTSGSLGAGTIMCNIGNLTRDNMPSDSSMPTCTWHQTDSSTVTVTATNEFDISVTEVEQTFATACTTVPTGGQCSSMWTWHMVKSTTKSTTNGCM
jgi:hypothetical protein